MPFELDTTTLPGRMKAYRCIHGLSQEQLARVLFIDECTVCSWESERHTPNKDLLAEVETKLEKGLNWKDVLNLC